MKEDDLIHFTEIPSNMWYVSALTVLGLLLNLVGAITLIGNQWKPTTRVGYWLNPQFKHINNGLRTLGNEKDEIGLDDPEFQPLFDLVDPPTEQFTVPADGPVTPSEILPPTDENDNRVVFVHEVDTAASNLTKTQNIRMEMEHLQKLARSAFQTWFIKIGATLIAIGFGVRIIAEVIPFL